MKIGICEMLKRARTQPSATLLGIGPMSPAVLQAAFELARDLDFPLMLIASRNQVDAREFGSGYVAGWDQTDFVNACKKMADSVGFDGLYYLCRDHGGPWQRDEERNAALPEEEAMARGLRSYIEDLRAGFDLLHIDPTKDPHQQGIVPLDLVLTRTVSLIRDIEAERLRLDLPPIGYEVGTEETNGGLTDAAAFEGFLKKLCAMLDQENLPRPQFIVGQTGTLVRLTENVGRFSHESAKELARIARAMDVGLKEHNSDYLSDEQLLLHPAMAVTASNVAPEFGVVETDACRVLIRTAADLGYQTELLAMWQRAAVASGRWRKWMTDGVGEWAEDRVLADGKLTERILEICGHYCFDMPEIAHARLEMETFLEENAVDARRYVLQRIKVSMARYVNAYGLAGMTTKVLSMEETAEE